MAMRSQPIADFYSESTDIAEIHSMSMEQFAYPYAEWFFGDQADKFRFAHLQEALTFVPFGVAVDEFQHICYAHPEMTPKERTYQWHLLEEKYMPWRRYEDDAFMERGGYWYHKLHIYLYPFYYINYTLTTMGAMEFKKKYAENRDGGVAGLSQRSARPAAAAAIWKRCAMRICPIPSSPAPWSAPAGTRRKSCSSRLRSRRSKCKSALHSDQNLRRSVK